MRGLPATLGMTLAALAALLLAGQSLRTLESARRGLEVTRSHVDAIPVTVFRPAGGAPAGERPVVVIAHGYDDGGRGGMDVRAPQGIGAGVSGARGQRRDVLCVLLPVLPAACDGRADPRRRPTAMVVAGEMKQYG